MRKRNGIGRTLLQALGLLSASVLYAQQPDHPAAALESHIMLTPEEIPWRQCPPALPPGAQCAVVEGDMTAANRLFAYRVKMPDNYRIAPHFHPADEHLVVLRGVFNMGMGDELDTRASRPMTAGSFVVMPKEKHHFAWTKGETIVQVYAIGPWGLTYVDAKDDPRNR
jgi:quercetin dioxygenase-like cupin family protein